MMDSENIYLTKKYEKFVEFGYSIMYVFFENALKHMELFHFEVNILRE